MLPLRVWVEFFVCRDGVEHPVAYYSRQTRAQEEKYSASELECLALVETLEHFKAYLIGKHFKVYTDHKALQALLTSTSLNSRLWRWVVKLMDYDMQICYRKGSDNVVPDALSRQGWPERISQVDGLRHANLLSQGIRQRCAGCPFQTGLARKNQSTMQGSSQPSNIIHFL